MFKKIILPVMILAAFAYAGCTKSSASGGCVKVDSPLIASDSEVNYIRAYLAANNLTATKDTSGIFYTITAPGSGAKPSICSYVFVKYTGYLFSGFKFTENLGGSIFALTGLILGWQKGMELVPKGGSITIYIPPSLGYGSTANGIIPANSYLIFTVQLVDIL